MSNRNLKPRITAIKAIILHTFEGLGRVEGFRAWGLGLGFRVWGQELRLVVELSKMKLFSLQPTPRRKL